MEFISERDAIAVVGAERFKRLRYAKPFPWLSPFTNVEGREGVPLYRRDLVLLRLEEDRRAYPSAVIAKSAGVNRSAGSAAGGRSMPVVKKSVGGSRPPAVARTLAAEIGHELDALRQDNVALARLLGTGPQGTDTAIQRELDALKADTREMRHTMHRVLGITV